MMVPISANVSQYFIG